MSGLTTLPTQPFEPRRFEPPPGDELPIAEPSMAAPAAASHPVFVPRARVQSQPVLPPTDVPIDEPVWMARQRRRHPVKRSGVTWAVFNTAVVTQLLRSLLAAAQVGALEPDVAGAVHRVARAQALTAVGSALLAALLALAGQPWAVWALIFTVIAGIGAGLTDVLLRWHDTSLLAGIVLLCSQLALLVWAFELDGPRMALLACVPALALFALRVAGPAFATYMTAALLALYGAWTLLRVRDIFPTAMHWSHSDAVAFDAVVAAAGLFLTVMALLDIQRRCDAELRLAMERTGPGTRVDEVRIAYARLLMELDADVGRLSQALSGELGTTGWPWLSQPDETTLLRLEELIDFAATRINTLQRDHEERIRLEGALARVQRAVELLELGRTPRWPEPSGTAVDALVSRLRELYPDGAPARMASGGPILPYSSHSGSRPNPAVSTPTGVLLPWRAERDEAGT